MERYDSYKDSGIEWIGEIPSHWGRQKLKYCGELICGGTPSTNKEEYWDGQIPWIQSGKVHFKDIIPEDVDKYITELGFDKSSTKMVKRNSPVLAITGATCSNVGFLRFDSAVNQSVIGVHVNKVNLPRYIYYYLISQKKQILYHQSGGAQGGVSKGIVENLDIVQVKLEEQQQIASFLDTKTSLIDSLIEKTQRKIEILIEKRTSLINGAVTKGLNPNLEMKDIGVEWIGKIPSHWNLTKIKYKMEIFGRIGFRGYTTDDIVDEGEGVITISPSNIKNDVFNLNDRTYLSWEKYHESPEIQIFKDDIILVKTGSTIGKTSIIPDGVPEMTINPQLVVMKKIKLFPKFLYYQTTCKFIKESFDIEQTGSTTPTISQEKINEFPLVNPPLSEQQQIVEYLDKQTQRINKSISIEEKRIELLKEYRQSLISEVVTGKRKVF